MPTADDDGPGEIRFYRRLPDDSLELRRVVRPDDVPTWAREMARRLLRDAGYDMHESNTWSEGFWREIAGALAKLRRDTIAECENVLGAPGRWCTAPCSHVDCEAARYLAQRWAEARDRVRSLNDKPPRTPTPPREPTPTKGTP